MPKHLLSCSCGENLAVEPRQAGEALTCVCGKSVQAPPLRELRQLPQLEQEQSDGRSWTIEQGITFACGAVVIFVATVCLVIFFKEWVLLDTTDRTREVIAASDRTVDALNYIDAYKFYLRISQQGIGEKQIPDYVKNQRRADVLMKRMMICGGIVILGTLIAASSFWIGGSGKRARRGQG